MAQETEETSQETSQEPEVEERSKKEARLIIARSARDDDLMTA